MTGLGERGLSIRRARTMIEVGVLAVGFALGGTVGVGTVVYALAIGPLAAFFIPRFSNRRHGSNRSRGDRQPFGPTMTLTRIVSRRSCDERGC